MRPPNANLCAAALGAAAILLAGCTNTSHNSAVGLLPTVGVPSAGTSLPQSIRSLPTIGHYATGRIGKNFQKETVLWSFTGSNGDQPQGTLINVNGYLWGVASSGGANGAGTLFDVLPNGGGFYSFGGGGDGLGPFGRVVYDASNYTLYGTTTSGGAFGHGTVWSYDLYTLTEKVIHSFSGSDGSNPECGLTLAGSALYGVTSVGGASNHGVVFKMTLAGKETVLHNFGGTDGAYPLGELLKIKSTLYGTTQEGGASGNGTVYSISTAGTETVLHSFSVSDGEDPIDLGGLINIGSTLYGTTSDGGASYLGTVFKVTTSGSFTSLYSFENTGDGTYPFAGLTNVNGTLFGVTTEGGIGCRFGCGTIFELLPNGGPELVVYNFTGGSDGSFPMASLINVNGTLYGTTDNSTSNGLGTVFSLSF